MLQSVTQAIAQLANIQSIMYQPVKLAIAQLANIKLGDKRFDFLSSPEKS